MGWLYLLHFGDLEIFYIGSTVTTLARRRSMHLEAMQQRRASSRLQEAYDLSGGVTPTLVPLKELDPPLLYQREDEMIWKLKPPLNTRRGYAKMARSLGLHEATVKRRAERGLDVTAAPYAVERKPHVMVNIRRYDVGGEHLMVREICERSGASDSLIRARIEQGIRGPALLAPASSRGRPRKT